MPHVQEKQMPELLRPFFGDGPPRWKMGHGKSWERWCYTEAEAHVRRQKVVGQLRHQLSLERNFALAILMVRLRACRPEAPCFSGACPVCVRALQKWFVATGDNLGTAMITDMKLKPRILSLVPDFGQVKSGALRTFDMPGFRRKSIEALRLAGIPWFRGALDVSFNHEIGDRENGHFQFQWWGLVEEVDKQRREKLRAELNQSQEILRPVYQFRPSWPKAALAYGAREAINRREAIWDEDVCARGRAACRDTRNRELKGAEGADVKVFLHRIGLRSRLMLLGSSLLPRT